MAKDKLPKPIYFPVDDLISKQRDIVEAAANKRYKELVDKKCYKDIYLIVSGHWAGKGYWITFELPELSNLDILVREHHNKNPKPWIPPPPNESDEDDEE